MKTGDKVVCMAVMFKNSPLKLFKSYTIKKIFKAHACCELEEIKGHWFIMDQFELS